MDRATPVARQVGIQEIFVLGSAPDATPFASLLDHDAPLPPVSIDPAADLAVLPYSSGTTGFPKGVMLTHRNLVANLLQTDRAFHLAQDERIIAVLPFYHIYGMQVVLNLALWRGATLVTMPKFELDRFLGALQQYRITWAFVVPPLVLALAKDAAVDGYDLSSVRTIVSGAAPLDATLQTACARPKRAPRPTRLQTNLASASRERSGRCCPTRNVASSIQRPVGIWGRMRTGSF